jgi:hypothetical protein
MMPELAIGRIRFGSVSGSDPGSGSGSGSETIGDTTARNMQETAALKRSKEQVNAEQTLTLINGCA